MYDRTPKCDRISVDIGNPPSQHPHGRVPSPWPQSVTFFSTPAFETGNLVLLGSLVIFASSNSTYLLPRCRPWVLDFHSYRALNRA